MKLDLGTSETAHREKPFDHKEKIAMKTGTWINPSNRDVDYFAETDQQITLDIPDIEILAGFRMSYLTAQRENFPRTAAQVEGYLRELEYLNACGYKLQIIATKGN